MSSSFKGKVAITTAVLMTGLGAGSYRSTTEHIQITVTNKSEFMYRPEKPLVWAQTAQDAGTELFEVQPTQLNPHLPPNNPFDQIKVGETYNATIHQSSFGPFKGTRQITTIDKSASTLPPLPTLKK